MQHLLLHYVEVYFHLDHIRHQLQWNLRFLIGNWVWYCLQYHCVLRKNHENICGESIHLFNVSVETA